jgi:Protein of unknown function (DUF3592)
MFTALFALFLGLFMTYAGANYVSLARRMRLFRSVQGTVVAREVVLVPGGNTRTGVFGQGGGYMPSVRYRYVVDGVELEGDKISFAYSGYKRALAERKLDEIPAQVSVWYNPEKPTEAYLKKHTATLGLVLVAFGGLFSMGALGAVIAAFFDRTQ